MKKYTIAALCVCALVGAAPAAKNAAKDKKGQVARMPVPPMSKKRVAEIASYLPERPAAPGARISDRAAWEKLQDLPSSERIMRNAEALLRRPIPEIPDELYLEYSKIGVRTTFDIPYHQRMSSAVTLATAECLENKGRFVQKLIEYLDVICAERSWVQSAHDRGMRTFDGKEFNVDLGASERAWSCAWIVSALKGTLPLAVSEKVKGEIARRIFAPYREKSQRTSNFAPMGWFNGPANWTAVCHSGVVKAALSVIESRNERALFVESAERFLPFYIAGFPDDGYCSEGMGYWNYGWGHYLSLAFAVKDATGGKVDFFKDPKTKTIMAFGTGCQLTDGRAPDFADGGGSVSDYVLLLGHRQWPDLPLNATAIERDLMYGGISAFTLRAFGQLDGIPPPKLDPLPMRNVFPYGQVWIMRPDPKSEGTGFTVGVKGGHNAEFHNHNDVGSYAVMFGNVMMSGDPGNSEYTALTFSPARYTIPVISSFGHPVPELNGVYQKNGRQYAAKVLSTSFSNDVDRVTLEIAGAYPAEAKVRSLVRTFTYRRNERVFSVKDHVWFKLKGRFVEPVLTVGYLTPQKEKGSFRLTANSGTQVQECDVTVQASGGDWSVSEGKRIDNPNRPAPMRYAIQFAEPVAEAEVTVTFKAHEDVLGTAVAAEAPPPDAAENEEEERPGPVLYDETAGVKATICYGGLEERVLAREIQWYLGEMTEETFRLSGEEPASGPFISIKLDPGDARVVSQKDRVLISGHGRGLSMAVSHFLEELGIRFLMPGDIGRVIPGKLKVMYPDSDWREPPRAPGSEEPPMEKKRLIALLKSPVPVKRDFYAWHGVDASAMPAPTADGWELYMKVKGVDASDAEAREALLTDFRRTAYGPAARIMNEYFKERAKPAPDVAKLAEIVGRAAVEAAHEPAISARIRAISESLGR